MRRALASATLFASLASVGTAQAIDITVDDLQARLQRRADAMMGVMGFQVIPDITTTSLSITDPTAGSPDILISQLGAGFTISDDFPLYLEGMLAYGRYDPQFVANDGTSDFVLPVKWNSIALTASAGWDFKLADKLKFRPMVTGTIGYLASDLKVLDVVADDWVGPDLDFLRGGSLRTWGIGGAAVLDFEDYTPEREIDIELRYSGLRLTSYGGAPSIQGDATVGSVNLWGRWRAPLGNWTAFNRPVRYALELTYSEFLYDQRGALGFDRLTSLGAGVELDLSDGVLLQRARMMGRYVFGENISGFAVGFAVTF